MGFSKPSVQLNWILDDSASKYTVPSGPDQLAGHINDTNADNKIFNWCWWRMSQWIEFLDNTFDSNGNEVNAPKSTTITETVAPAASTVTLDAGGIKSWDGSSNAIFSVTEPGVVTIGYNGNDIISLTAGVLSVATATAADLVKLHAITPSAADINPLLGASGNGLVVADITKLADIDASAAEIDQLDGVVVGGNSTGDIITREDTQDLLNKTMNAVQNTIFNLEHGDEVDDPTTGVHGVGAGLIVGSTLSQSLTNKTINANNNTISNLEHGAEVDNLTVAHGATGAVVGTTNVQTLTNKTLTSPKINEDVVLVATSTQIDAAVGYANDAILGDGTVSIKLRRVRVLVQEGTSGSGNIKVTTWSSGNDTYQSGFTAQTADDITKGNTVSNVTLSANGSIITFESGLYTGTLETVITTDVEENEVSNAYFIIANKAVADAKFSVFFHQVSGAVVDISTAIGATADVEFYITFLTA